MGATAVVDPDLCRVCGGSWRAHCQNRFRCPPRSATPPNEPAPRPAVVVVAPSAVDHPPHYNASPAKCSKCGHPIECIDVVETMGFSLGNVIKYLWRADLKGKLIEDLKKAAWYLNREIERREKL